MTRSGTYSARRGQNGLRLIVAVLILAGSVAVAQVAQQPLPKAPSRNDPFNAADRPNDPMVDKLHNEQMKAVNEQRQKQLVSDTDKLLQLATELKAEVDKTDKETLSVAVIRKTEQIEKLAKSVRERMKTAQ